VAHYNFTYSFGKNITSINSLGVSVILFKIKEMELVKAPKAEARVSSKGQNNVVLQYSMYVVAYTTHTSRQTSKHPKCLFAWILEETCLHVATIWLCSSKFSRSCVLTTKRTYQIFSSKDSRKALM
jgi:hypothetical protein